MCRCRLVLEFDGVAAARQEVLSETSTSLRNLFTTSRMTMRALQTRCRPSDSATDTGCIGLIAVSNHLEPCHWAAWHHYITLRSAGHNINNGAVLRVLASKVCISTQNLVGTWVERPQEIEHGCRLKKPVLAYLPVPGFNEHSSVEEIVF